MHQRLSLVITTAAILQTFTVQVTQASTPIINPLNGVSHEEVLRKKHPSSGPQIELITEKCQLKPETREKVEKGIAFLYNFYSSQLDYRFSREVVVRIRIFGDNHSYRNYIDTLYPTIPKNWIGVYLSSVNEILVSMEPDEKAFFQNIFHETSHLLLSNRVKSAPNWFNEGLAEYFEYMEVTDEGVVVKPQVVKDRRTKKWITGRICPNIFNSFGITNRDWNIADGNSESDEPRTMAWSVTYFLMSSDKGKEFVKDLIPYLSKYPHDAKASVKAIETYYAGGRRQFEKDWKQWVLQPRKDHVLTIQPLDEPRVASFWRNLVD